MCYLEDNVVEVWGGGVFFGFASFVGFLSRARICRGRWRQGIREGEEKRMDRKLGLGLRLERKGPRGRELE